MQRLHKLADRMGVLQPVARPSSIRIISDKVRRAQLGEMGTDGLHGAPKAAAKLRRGKPVPVVEELCYDPKNDRITQDPTHS